MPEPFPLHWPTDVPRSSPRKSPFKAAMSLARCRDDMTRQFELLGAKKLLISSNVPLRLDGRMLADAPLARPDPGVAVYYTHPRYGAQVIACDRWNNVAANLWAVKRTIECIRSIARYGTTEMVEKAMAGFAGALPHLTPAAPWWVILQFNEQQASTATAAQIDERARELLKRYHPDSAQGGDAARFSLITEARATARKLFQPEGVTS